jgi:hypothetical protein
VKVKSKQLAGVIHQWVVQILNSEPWASYIGNRMFSAIITDVSNFGLGVVTVAPLNGGGASAGEWICAVTDYVPKVGDRVEMIRQDDVYGYVAYPLVHPFKPHFKVRLTTTHSLPSGSWGAVPFNSVIEDPWGAWSTANNTWTAPAEGMYQVNLHLKSQPPVSQTSSQVALYVNGSSAETCGDWQIPTTYYVGFTWAGLVHLNAGDTLSVETDASAAVYLQVSDSPSACQLSGFYVGPTK